MSEPIYSDGEIAPSRKRSRRLPPGFRFHPTDKELVNCYLVSKVLKRNHSMDSEIIGEVDFTKCEPWNLPAMTKIGCTAWYFFSLRDKKYLTGTRTNRSTGAGYWKATGKDRQIVNSGSLIGFKKTLVFYTGRSSRGERTSWIMHEYRLEDNVVGPAIGGVHDRPNDEKRWVVCRVFKKHSDN